MLNKANTIIAVIIIFLIAMYGIAIKGSVEYEEITVEDKWVKYHGNDAKYLISSTTGEVYSIEDSCWFLSFDASNRYAQIKANETYNIKTIGWRVPILSWYNNIIEINHKEQ